MPSKPHEADTFAAALHCLAPEVMGYLARILRDGNEAQDVWQQAQIVALDKRDQLREEGSLRPWVYRIAYHLALDALSKRPEGGGETGELDRVPAASSRTPTIQAVRTTNKRTLREVIDELPVLQKTLVVLRIDKKLSWNEIADVLETSATGEPMTATNARQTFHRLIRDLKQAFSELGLLAGRDEEVR